MDTTYLAFGVRMEGVSSNELTTTVYATKKPVQNDSLSMCMIRECSAKQSKEEKEGTQVQSQLIQITSKKQNTGHRLRLRRTNLPIFI